MEPTEKRKDNVALFAFVRIVRGAMANRCLYVVSYRRDCQELLGYLDSGPVFDGSRSLPHLESSPAA
jgi:hypothetical protein